MSDFDSITVVVSGPLVQLAKFQSLLQSLEGALSLSTGKGNDDGSVGVLQWSGVFSTPQPFPVRGPKPKK